MLTRADFTQKMSKVQTAMDTGWHVMKKITSENTETGTFVYLVSKTAPSLDSNSKQPARLNRPDATCQVCVTKHHLFVV